MHCGCNEIWCGWMIQCGKKGRVRKAATTKDNDEDNNNDEQKNVFNVNGVTRRPRAQRPQGRHRDQGQGAGRHPLAAWGRCEAGTPPLCVRRVGSHCRPHASQRLVEAAPGGTSAPCWQRWLASMGSERCHPPHCRHHCERHRARERQCGWPRRTASAWVRQRVRVGRGDVLAAHGMHPRRRPLDRWWTQD
jgi:hypothetical protein